MLRAKLVTVIPSLDLGWGDTAPSGTTDRTATGLREAGSYEVTPCDRVLSSGSPGQADESISRQSERTSAGVVESDLAWAPTHTLTMHRSGGSLSGRFNPRCRLYVRLITPTSGIVQDKFSGL